MKVPIISKIFKNRELERTAKINYLKAQTSAFNERTIAMKEMQVQTKEIMKSLIARTEKPVMSLNDELYGNMQTPYNTDLWSYSSDRIRRISRIGHSQSSPAQAMVGRFVDLVYGTHLELQAQPFFDLLQGSPTDIKIQQSLIKNIERRWWLWAKSDKSDYEQDKNFFCRSRDMFERLLIDGEFFVILRYNQNRGSNPLTLQYISADDVMMIDSQVLSGNIEKDGIEYNSKGIAVAYHIRNKKIDGSDYGSVRIPRYGIKSGRTFVLHIKLGQALRGIGILAGVISELTKLSDFQALEIQAAVINAIFAVWIETPIGGENKEFIKKKGISGIGAQIDQAASNYSPSEYNARMKTTDLQHGGIIAEGLGEGQKVNSFDTKRPNVNFEQFYNAVLRNLASAKGMSLAVMLYNFNGQYAAARGELLVLWNKISTMRFDQTNAYESQVYKMWLWGEIDNNNVPDFGYGKSEFIRDAFSNSVWTGPARPDIDPLKSVQANIKEVYHGFKTNQEVAAERGGGDFDENIGRIKNENIQKADANAPMLKVEKTTYSEATTNSTTVTEGA